MTRLRNRISLFWIGLLFILLLAGELRFLSYRFSLPYVDHPDEPAYYLGGQEWRGLYNSGGYYNGIPPAYVALNAAVQPILEASGKSGLAPTVELLRFVAVIVNLITLIFIALTARLAGGDFAGLVAGMAWGVSPLVLENGVYALPDPFIYCFTALALWLAALALLQPSRRVWCVWSVVAGLLAVLMKYPALPALLPGVLVALVTVIRERRRWRLLVIQAVLIGVTGFWLVFIYGVDFNNLQREGATVKSQGLSNFLNMSRTIHNVIEGIIPIQYNAFVIMAILGLITYVWASRQHLPRIEIQVIGLALILIITIPWLTNTFSRVTSPDIRYVLPATTAACVVLGLSAAQIRNVISNYVVIAQKHHPNFIASVMFLPLIALVWIPQWNADWQLVQDRRQPDRRVDLREWFDANFDPGTIIVNDENHKTFNPLWGGIPYRRWVDWWISNNIMEHPLDEWINQRGMSYTALPESERQAMESTAEGKAYLAHMLPLRDFLAPDQRGPQMVFYRLWRMQIETDIPFGDSIHLIGYDQSSATVKPGDTITFHFYWQAMTTPADNYSLFVHFTALHDVKPLSQVDGAPAAPERPTLSWSDPTETLISSPFALNIPADLPPGDYRIQIGLYNYLTNQRLSVQDATGKALGDSYELTTISVSK